MATMIKTASINEKTGDNLNRIRERGIGFSEFIRLAAQAYIDNGYGFNVVVVVDEENDGNKAAI